MTQLTPPSRSDRTRAHSVVVIREASLDSADAVTVSGLVRAYLERTETEKRAHGAAASGSGYPLTPPHEREVSDPRTAYAGCVTLIAEVDRQPAGVVIVKVGGGVAEIKRLWADADLRGIGVGGALLDTALSVSESDARLSVWHWRTAAIRLYESRGFERVASWEDRAGLVCMVRRADER